MKNETKEKARDLYAHSNLTKTQIAAMLGISRTALHGWVREGYWDRLKQAAEHLPSILAEKCYHIFGHVADAYLSERRLTNPVNHQEADTLYKLMLTIQKLKNRSTINESMEMFKVFEDRLVKENPRLAEEIFPYIDDHLAARGTITTGSLMPDNFTHLGRLPFDPPEKNWEEEALDNNDISDWTMAQLDMEEQASSAPQNTDNQPETANN